STVFYSHPSTTVITPQTADAKKLQLPTVRWELTTRTVSLVGPAVSGVLVATVGPAVSFAIDAATFAASATSLAFLNTRQITGIERKNFWRELEDGIRAVAARRWYLLNLGAHAVWNFAFAAFLVAGPIVARDQLGGASAWGFIGTSMAAGSMLGGLIALRVTPRRPLIVANLVLALSSLQLLAIAVPAPIVVIMAARVVGEAALIFLNEVWFATIPQLLPAD